MSAEDESGASAYLQPSNYDPEHTGEAFQAFLSAMGGRVSWSDSLFAVETLAMREQDKSYQKYPYYGLALLEHGAALGRDRSDTSRPRFIGAITLSSIPKERRNSMFFGYAPAENRLEIIAPNEKGNGNAGYTDFIVVMNYGPGLTPTIVSPPAGVCVACHKFDQPFDMNGWRGDALEKYFVKDRYFPEQLKVPHTVDRRSGLAPTLQKVLTNMLPFVDYNPKGYSLVDYFSLRDRIDQDLCQMLVGQRKCDVERNADAIALKGRFAGDPITPDRDPLLVTLHDPVTHTGEPGVQPMVSPEVVAIPDVPQPETPACNGWQDLAGNAARGEEVYERRCARCHRAPMTTDYSIPPLHFDTLKTDVGANNVERTALNLVERCIMPPRRADLSANPTDEERLALDQDRADLVAFLRQP